MKRAAVIFIIIALVFSMAATSYAYTLTDYDMISSNFSTIRNDSGFFMLGWSENVLDVKRVVPDPTGSRLSLSKNIIAASVFDNTVAAVCDDRSNDQLIIYTYDIDRDDLESFAVLGARVRAEKGFYYDGNCVYLPDESKASVVNRYSVGGELLDSFDFGSNLSFVFSGYCSELYVISGGKLYKHIPGGYKAIGAGFYEYCRFISGDILGDRSGRFYRISDNSKLLFTADGAYNADSACAADGYVYCPSGKNIIRYSMNGYKQAYLTLDNSISSIYACNGKLYSAYCYPGISEVSANEFIEYKNEKMNDKVDTSGRLSPISSDIYTVDNIDYRITGIASPTTFAEFKRNMNYDGYTAELFRGSKRIKTGNIGTAMTVVFESDSDICTYELSVVGDISGEGSVNKSDLNELMDCLLGSINFDGVYYIAADIDNSGSVDARDLALLARMK